jgi:predicted aspartyl protease
MRRHLAVAAAFLLSCVSAPPLLRTAAVPIEVTQNHVYVPVSVGKNAPSWFLLDTGAAVTAVAQTTAEALHLRAGERGRVRGAGPAIVETSVFHDLDLDVGGNAMHVSRVAGIPLLEPSLVEGRALEGILGRSVIGQAAITVDYERRELRFGAGAPEGAVVVPITFNAGRPVVAAELTLNDGRVLPLRMLVDTGARSILLNRPFTEEHGIYDALAPSIEGPFSVGIGGVSRQLMGRAKRFAFAGFTFDAPIVAAAKDAAGATAERELDGLIGGEILRRFTVTFDYARRRMLLVPNRRLHDPFDVDMSGAGYKAADLKFDRILVRYVIGNSPASEAGLEERDEIVSVDGNKVTLGQLRALFGEPGKHHVVRVRRGGREFDATIVTRRLV